MELRYAVTDRQRSNRDLEQFTYSASHDQQEPLHMVSSFVGLLPERYLGQIDADADAYIDFVIHGTARMKELIEHSLDFSRAGGTLKCDEQVDLEFLVQAAWASHRHGGTKINGNIEYGFAADDISGPCSAAAFVRKPRWKCY